MSQDNATTFDFSIALAHLKNGDRVARSGWNGKGMWLEYVATGDTYLTRSEPSDEIEGAQTETLIEIEQFILMKTADNKLVPWLCSQTDMLAEDWGVVQ